MHEMKCLSHLDIPDTIWAFVSLYHCPVMSVLFIKWYMNMLTITKYIYTPLHIIRRISLHKQAPNNKVGLISSTVEPLNAYSTFGTNEKCPE